MNDYKKPETAKEIANAVKLAKKTSVSAVSNGVRTGVSVAKKVATVMANRPNICVKKPDAAVVAQITSIVKAQIAARKK